MSEETRAATGSTRHGPLILAPNQPERPYRGGGGIARLRGLAPRGQYVPEDFLASTTTVHGCTEEGLTMLPGGVSLRSAIEADPEWFLSPAHLRRFGPQPQLLVKLLNPEQRLFAHFHPDDTFARTHLHAATGKTEAWVVVDAPPGGGRAHLGFREQVAEATVVEWIRQQDASSVLAAMHRVDLHEGSALLVPAGLPHALDPGFTIVELQQPADLSILLEYEGFPGFTEESALLGLDPSLAAQALDRRPWTRAELQALGDLRGPGDCQAGLSTLLPASADPFFRAQAIRADGSIALFAEFSVLVVTAGSGRLLWGGEPLELTRGVAVLVPYGIGEVVIEGALTAVRCMPPAPGGHWG